MLAQFAELTYNVFNSIQEAFMRVFNIKGDSVTLRSYAGAAVEAANEKEKWYE